MFGWPCVYVPFYLKPVFCRLLHVQHARWCLLSALGFISNLTSGCCLLLLWLCIHFRGMCVRLYAYPLAGCRKRIAVLARVDQACVCQRLWWHPLPYAGEMMRLTVWPVVLPPSLLGSVCTALTLCLRSLVSCTSLVAAISKVCCGGAYCCALAWSISLCCVSQQPAVMCLCCAAIVHISCAVYMLLDVIGHCCC